MQDFRVADADALKALARDLNKAGRGDLKVALKKRVNRHVRDNRVRELVADSALKTLPSGGGHERGPRKTGRRQDGSPRVPRRRSRNRPTSLAEYVAKARVKVATNLGGRNLGVTITGTRSAGGKKVDLDGINDGSVRHPTFGRRPWRTQRVRPGFFDRPLKGRVADDFRRAVTDAVGDIRRQLGG